MLYCGDKETGVRVMSNVRILSPFIRRAWYDIIEPPRSISERVLFDYELLYIKAGNVLIDFEGLPFECSAGDVVLLKPGQRHTIEIYGHEQFIQPHIHFDLYYYPDREEVPVSFLTYEDMSERQLGYIREDVLKRFIPDFPFKIRLENDSLFESLLFDVISEFNHPSFFHDIAITGLFMQLWNYFLNEVYWYNKKPLRSKQEQMLKVKHFLDHNLNRAVRMEELCNVVFMEKHSISNMFKEAYGETPIQYHANLRIKKAKMMIKLTNLSLSEISDSLGYDSIHSFSRAFKQIEGFPPSTLRADDPVLLANG